MPPRPARLTAFPLLEIAAGARWYRVHHRRHSPWWYSSSPGRFNLRPPRGTLNLASTAEAAAREMLGPALVGGRRIPITQVSGLSVTCLRLPRTSVADLLDARAPMFGVVAGDMAAPRHDAYELTRAWAEAFDVAGFGGLRSRSRFGAGEDPQCLYLFGEAGEHETGAIGRALRLRGLIEEQMGLDIDPVLDSSELVVED
jgi:hypothetical protein